MTARVQESRAATPNTPPADYSLSVGQLYVEMADPLRLWVGVPTAVAPSGTRLIIDASAQAAANAGAVQKAGDTMTGPLTLSGPPTLPAQAANRAYVDGFLVSPVFTGDPRAPTPPAGDSDTSLATTAFVATSFAPLASPVLTGDPRAPTPALGDNDTSIATTAFVAGTIAAGPPAGAVISATVPVEGPGTLWWDSTGGQLYVRYDDGNSSQWVTAVNLEGLANAATKGDVAAAQNNTGRNLLHNPLFNVAQRGAGPFNATGAQAIYSADRWVVQSGVSGDTMGLTLNPMTDAMRSQIGDEAATSMASLTIVGTANAGSICRLLQKIENVRRLAGKTVTVSFWAVGNVTNKLGVSLDQFFGTGGSPSASVTGTGQAVTISAATWARYSVTLSIPSAGGKITGTNGDSSIILNIWASAGSNYATASGGVGNQGSWFANLWGVQLEIGSVATPLEKPDPRYDLANCQRFYCTGQYSWFGYGALSYNTSMYTLPMTMRGTPTIINNVTSNVNANSPTIDPSSPSVVRLNIQCPVAGGFNYAGSFTASADL